MSNTVAVKFLPIVTRIIAFLSAFHGNNKDQSGIECLPSTLSSNNQLFT